MLLQMTRFPFLIRWVIFHWVCVCVYTYITSLYGFRERDLGQRRRLPPPVSASVTGEAARSPACRQHPRGAAPSRCPAALGCFLLTWPIPKTTGGEFEHLTPPESLPALCRPWQGRAGGWAGSGRGARTEAARGRAVSGVSVPRPLSGPHGSRVLQELWTQPSWQARPLSSVLRAHPCCSVGQNFLPFYCWVTLRCLYVLPVFHT